MALVTSPDWSRDAGSRRLAERSRAAARVGVPAPLHLLDAVPLEIVNLSHLGGIDSDQGWGEDHGKRLVGELLAQTLDLDHLTLSVAVRDLRRTPLLGAWEAWDRARGTSPAGGALMDGPASVRPHNGAHYFRGSTAWVDDPRDGLVRAVPENVLPLGPSGLACEGRSRNLLVRSSAKSQMTGVTTTGTGTNGSNITADGDSLIFDPAETAYSWLFLAGSPHAADMYLTEPATATVTAGTDVFVSADHWDPDGEAIALRITRAVDGWYWNNATPGWQAGSVWNALPVRQAAPGRDELLPIGVGGINTTVTVQAGLTSGGTAARTNRLYHLQLEEGKRWRSSRILTDGAAVTREAALMVFQNDTGRRYWPASRGTLLVRLSPSFLGSNASGCTFPLFRVVYDEAGNNYVTAYYDGSAGGFKFERRSGGAAAVYASFIWDVTGGELALGFRWASATGSGVVPELDDDYGAAPSGEQRFDLWVEGEARASNTSVQPVESSASYVLVGGSTGPTAVEGFIRQWRVVPLVLDSPTMRRLTA